MTNSDRNYSSSVETDGGLRELGKRHFRALQETQSLQATKLERVATLDFVLFEITVDNLDERFGIGDFTQEMPEAPMKAWQRAYDEALLSADGTQVIARKSTCTHGVQSGRIAFYFHYYDPLKTMQWTYGQFSGPAVQLVPERLWNLVPYSPVD